MGSTGSVSGGRIRSSVRVAREGGRALPGTRDCERWQSRARYVLAMVSAVPATFRDELKESSDIIENGCLDLRHLQPTRSSPMPAQSAATAVPGVAPINTGSHTVGAPPLRVQILCDREWGETPDVKPDSSCREEIPMVGCTL
jgi:hypothetical protein